MGRITRTKTLWVGINNRWHEKFAHFDNNEYKQEQQQQQIKLLEGFSSQEQKESDTTMKLYRLAKLACGGGF